MGTAWYVGTTKDQQELKAASELREQGYQVYLPKIHVRHQDGRKVEARTHLRFTGYIFISFEPGQHSPISNTRGMDGADGSALICAMTRRGREPVALPPNIIEVLRQIEDEELARAIARKKPRVRTDLVPGETVEINNPGDAFHGKRGLYLGTEKFVARVLIGIAMKEIAEIDLKKVEEKRAA